MPSSKCRHRWLPLCTQDAPPGRAPQSWVGNLQGCPLLNANPVAVVKNCVFAKTATKMRQVNASFLGRCGACIRLQRVGVGVVAFHGLARLTVVTPQWSRAEQRVIC
jgi:hypothetical protein